MAKNNNLTDFLTNTAAAIRTAESSSGTINPQDFESKIKALKLSTQTDDATATAEDILEGKTAYVNGSKITGTSTSIGNQTLEYNDINFFDYDGTLLYTYTLNEVQNLTTLPELPSHDGLTCQGWNWTLADIKAENAPVNVGAIYITDNGKTRFYINIPEEIHDASNNGIINYSLIDINMYQYYGGQCTIDWGDGSNIEYTESGYRNSHSSHKYSEPGKYVISLTNNYPNSVEPIQLLDIPKFTYKIEIGNGLTALSEWNGIRNVETITIPNSVSSFYNYTYKNPVQYFLSKLYRLKHLNVPSSVIFEDEYVLNISRDLYSLKSISLPKNVFSGMDTPQIDLCHKYSLECISIPSTATLAEHAFQGCKRITKFVIPKHITTIPYAAFNEVGTCYIKFMGNISTIASRGIYISSTSNNRCVLDFSNHTSSTIPSLSSSDSITIDNAHSRILVPQKYYSSWCSATNWSALADKIVAV